MDAPDQSKPVDIPQWFDAAQRAAPLVGALVIIWSAFEIILEEDIRDNRWIACKGYTLPLDPRLPHKFRDRLNEWIRGLPEIGREGEGDAFRIEVMRLAQVRNNIAHNIHGMWIDTGNQLRFFTSFPNKNYDREWSAWTAKPVGKSPDPLLAVTYSGDEIQAAYNDIQACLNYALLVRTEVRVARKA